MSDKFIHSSKQFYAIKYIHNVVQPVYCSRKFSLLQTKTLATYGVISSSSISKVSGNCKIAILSI